MNEEPNAMERAFTELFQRLPTEPVPPGFREAVMARVALERVRRPWQWFMVAALAVPSLVFLFWEVIARGSELSPALGSIVEALLATDEWRSAEPSFYADGLLIVAISLIGLAGILMTHALLAMGDRSRQMLRSAR